MSKNFATDKTQQFFCFSLVLFIFVWIIESDCIQAKGEYDINQKLIFARFIIWCWMLEKYVKKKIPKKDTPKAHIITTMTHTHTHKPRH